MAKTKYCVTTAMRGSEKVTGIFSWRGKSWICAELLECVKTLPVGCDQVAEYKAFIKDVKAGKRMHRGAMRTEEQIAELEKLREEAFPHLYA